MNHLSRGASLAVLMMLTGGAAQAAITADQLWAAWKDAGAQADVTVSAQTETREGASLRLSGVTVSLANPENPAGAIEVTLDEMLLTDGADGTVTVVPSSELAMALETGADSLSWTLSHEGLQLVVTENLGEMTYDVTGDSLAADFLMSMAAADGSAAAAETSLSLTLETPDFQVVDTPDLNRSFAFDLSADSVSYDVTASDPVLQSRTVQSSTTQTVAMTGTFLAPATVPMASLTTPLAWAAAFRDGMALTVETAQGESAAASKDENAFLPMEMAITTLPGRAVASVSRDGLSVESTGEGATISVTSPAMPFPKLDLGFGPLAIRLAMPLMAGETAGDFGLTMKLSDVVANEEAWAAFDPGASLPRDAAQISIDTRGTAKLDIFAMDAAEAAGTPPVPPQPLTLEIPELLVSAAGTLLTGSGSFTFDNATGVPVPAGTADVTLTGGNALIDKLITIGLLTEEDAGGARMMMAMFMNATGDDVLTSKIEAKADGSISVNGQRVQ